MRRRNFLRGIMAAPLAVPLVRDAKPAAMDDAVRLAQLKAANPPLLYGGPAGGDMGRAGKLLAFDGYGRPMVGRWVKPT